MKVISSELAAGTVEVDHDAFERGRRQGAAEEREEVGHMVSFRADTDGREEVQVELLTVAYLIERRGLDEEIRYRLRTAVP